MTTTTIPQVLLESLPENVTLDECKIKTLESLWDEHYDVTSNDAPDDALVVVLPGWTADDGNCEVEYRKIASRRKAAEKYVADGDWGDRESTTTWITVCTWREGLAIDVDGDVTEVTFDRERVKVKVDPVEPECEDAQTHDWCSPIEVVGGIEENPGVWANGGGVIIKEVCRHCGCYRETDTWAQDMTDGTQGHTAVTYRDSDDESLAYIYNDGAFADYADANRLEYLASGDPFESQ